LPITVTEYNLTYIWMHRIIYNRIEYTVKPGYNSLGYNEFPVITEHIVFTDRIDLFKNWSVITKTRF
jgi:hypothetical protein